MADLAAKKVRFTNMTLLKNDELRPWTIDINLDRKLQLEAVALDKVLAFTTPQKFAGTLASSVLDAKLNEYAEFTTTLDQRIKTGIITSTGIVPRPETTNTTRAGDSTRNSSSRVDSSNNGSIAQSRSMTPAVDDDECFTAADLAYIDRMKRSSLYKRSMRSSVGRPHTSHGQSLQGIRYSEKPFGPVSPSKSKLMLTTFHNPKLKPHPTTNRALLKGTNKVLPAPHL